MAHPKQNTPLAPEANARAWYEVILVGSGILLVSAIYLYLRRFGQPLDDVIIKLLFAGTAVAGMALLGMSFAIGPLARFWPSFWVAKLPLRKHYGVVGFFIIVAHAIWGLGRLSPAHYPKWFAENGTLTLTGEFSLLFAVAGLTLFTLVALTSMPSLAERMTHAGWKFVQRLGYAAFALGLIHFTLLKWGGWVAFEKWPYNLPPLSLLLFIFVVGVFALRVAALIAPEHGSRE